MFEKTCSKNKAFTVHKQLQVPCQSYFFVKKRVCFGQKTFIKRVNVVNIGFLAQELPKIYSQFHIKTPCSGREKQGFRMKNPPK